MRNRLTERINNPKNDRITELIFKEVIQQLDDFHERLNTECKKVISGCGIKGKITKSKLTKLGYEIVYTEDGSARICKNGKIVSKVIFP